MSHTLIVPPSFQRQAKKFLKAHPDLRGAVADVLLGLEADPFQPRLRLHPLRGELGGCHAVSVTYTYRITLILQLAKHDVILLDIGSHDEV